MVVFAGSLTAFSQTLANSFYGIYIYRFFDNSFLTVALVFLFALLGAPLGLSLGRFFSRKVGVFPLLVFGSLLLAIGPFTYYFSTNIFLIAFSTFVSFMGSSILGISSSILSNKLIPEIDKKNFYNTNSVIMLIPYFLLIPLGGFLLFNSHFKIAFLIACLLLIVFVAPIYLILLLSYSKYN
jgi:MFS family permease